MPDQLDSAAALTPVSADAVEHAPSTGPAPGIALCLSGGGYRAMLFHLGTLWRLNQAGMLPHLARVSSVSGGSITSGVLGAHWAQLGFASNGVAANFEEAVITPICNLANQTIFDRRSVWTTAGSFIEGLFKHDQVIDAYRKYLFGQKSLQDLPGEENNGYTPRFVFNATNLQSGSLWRFSKPYMADWRVGMVKNPAIEIAVAVAASSAFPIGLPPVHLTFKPAEVEATPGALLHQSPYIDEAVLVDGGVYDNMGIETAWKEYKMILVSDAGGLTAPQPHSTLGGRDPARILSIMNNQVDSLRKRQVIASYQLDPANSEYREGAYWGIGSNVQSYGLPPESHLPCPFERTLKLAEVETVLQHLDTPLQQQLINWGFAICDVALRKHCTLSLQARGITLTPPTKFPYPDAAV